IGQLVVVFSAHRRQKHADAVDRDLELMWPLEPGHVADDVLQEADAEVVVGIQWEVVTGEPAPSCAARQAFYVILLRAIGRNTIDLARWRNVRITDRQAADLS